MPGQHNLYQEVVQITQTYLGPAAERFIDRQIESHLEVEPDRLSADDLAELIDWLKISVSFLTDDSRLVEDYVSQLRQLADESMEKP